MTDSKKRIITVLASFLVLTAVSTARADDVKEILRKVDAAGHMETGKMEVTQTIVTPSGDTRTFRMMSYSSGGNEKGLTEYLEPSQVKGMKILTLNDGDDIWTYFPSTNRVRKIASSARNRKVQGSDFTYDDMAMGKMARSWKGTVEGSEKIDGVDCHRLSLVPTASGPRSYSRAVAWVGKADSTIRKVVYYDLDGDKIKQLDMSGYKKIKGIWVPMEYTMTSLADGGKTVMKVNKVAVNPILDDSIFTEAGLSK